MTYNFFFFNDTATTEIYTLSLHDALPIFNVPSGFTEQWRTSSNTSTTSEMSQEIFASPGATGTIHGTLNIANSNITSLIHITALRSQSQLPSSLLPLRTTATGNNGAVGST